MTSWHSYPKIYNVGHAYVQNIFDGPVVIEEKLDGSQFSFGVFDGQIKVRSRGREFDVEAPDSLFERAAASVKALAPMLTDGWTYRGEYLGSQKHNILKYGSVPAGNIVLFDVSTGESAWLTHQQKVAEAERLGLLHTPVLFSGVVDDDTDYEEFLRRLCDRESVLGGVQMEGVVIKNYALLGPDKKTLMAKYVRESFREAHKDGWKKSNPTVNDVLASIIEDHRTEARWAKAMQRLKEAGALEGSPRDIGGLIKEAQRDTIEECKDEIMQRFWCWAKPQIERGVVRGLPEWYRSQLDDAQEARRG